MHILFSNLKMFLMVHGRYMGTWVHGMEEARGEGTPYSGLYREAPPESGAFFKLAVYKSVGKIAILVYEKVPKSAAKWKKRWLKRSLSE